MEPDEPEAAHLLLDQVCDISHAIPPVEVISANEYLLRLENNFSYESLPKLLSVALDEFGIHDKYYVTVNDCLSNLLMLGYSNEALETGETPCS